MGNLIEIEDALGNPTLVAVGGDGRVTSVTDRRGKEYVFAYSAEAGGLNAGNLASITAPSGPNSAPTRETTYTHDAYDRVTAVEDGGGNTVQFQVDGNDRVTRQTDPRGKYVDAVFVDGLLDYVDLPTNQGSSSNRRRTSFTYDDPGRVLQVIGKTGSSTSQTRVRHEFDGFSNLRKLARLKDSVEVIHEFNFDKLDRTLNALDPLLRETQVEHAPFCTSRTVITPRGIETTYSYDSLCRLVQVESPRQVILYEYDELGRPISISQDCHDRYGAATSLFGSAEFRAIRVTLLEYDPLDRVTKITFPGEETLEYQYDDEGAVIQMTDVHGKVTRYTYYNDGRLYQVILERPSVADRVFTYSYDAAGRLSQIDYPSSTNIVVKFSGPSSEDGWDEAGNLLHLRYLLSSSHLHRFAYTYDDSGNRISMVDTPTNTANAVTWEYGYDWLNRLISVSRDSTPMAVYTYDESDNRLSLEWPHLSETYNFTYDDANQLVNRKLATTTVETYNHDDDGNMIARAIVGGATTTYRWSDQNRLLQRKIDGDTQERMKYDLGGVRESKNDGTKYFSSGSVSVADMRPSNVPVSYFQGHQLLGMEVDGTFYYYLTDGLSNVRLVVNSSGTVVASSVYDEFGIPEADPEYTAGSAALRPHGYVGGLGVRNDWAASGLHYMRQRYYDPQLGRFLNQDPIGLSGGLNLYTGMSNNPVGWVDPSGLRPRTRTRQGLALGNVDVDFIKFLLGLPMPSYGPDSDRVADLKGSPIVNQARERYASKNAGRANCEPLKSGERVGQFGIPQFLDATYEMNLTRHYLGSFWVDMAPAPGNRVSVTLTDSKNSWSLLLHRVPESKKGYGGGFLRTQHQAYEWTEARPSDGYTAPPLPVGEALINAGYWFGLDLRPSPFGGSGL